MGQHRFLPIVVVTFAMTSLPGCIHPLARDITQQLKEQMDASYRTYRDATAGAQTLELDPRAPLSSVALDIVGDVETSVPFESDDHEFINLELVEALNRGGAVPPSLRGLFDQDRFQLRQLTDEANVTVGERSFRWVITDGEQYYLVKRKSLPAAPGRTNVMFNLPAQEKADLPPVFTGDEADDDRVPASLRRRFEQAGVTLGDQATISSASRDFLDDQIDLKWTITDRAHRRYIVHELAGGDLRVYEEPYELRVFDVNADSYLQEAKKVSGPRVVTDFDTLREFLGPAVAGNLDSVLGPDLLGQPDRKIVSLSLQRAIERAVNNNLEVKIGRLVPAVRDTQIVQAEAVFDAVLFANINHDKLDTPRPPSTITVFGSQETERTTVAAGVRKLMSTGGTFQVSTTSTRVDEKPSFFAAGDDGFDYYDVDISLTLQQPLLRNAGSDVTQSQIMLSRSARDQSIHEMDRTISGVVADTEQAYWELVYNYQLYWVLLKLLHEFEEKTTIVQKRKEVGQESSEQLAQLNRAVAQRKLEVTEAARSLGQASDQLKQLIYAEDLPLEGEELIRPLDTMIDAPIHFNLADAIGTALQSRPDMKIALAEISDATIRQRVADNQRLPLLDLSATMTYSGIQPSNPGAAYDELDDGDFIDYLLSLQFEVPFGNRAAQSGIRQRQIEREGAVINYWRTARTAVFDVKSALRFIRSAYRSIDEANDARLSSAEHTRILRENLGTIDPETGRIEGGGREGLDAAFIDRYIRSEETLTRSQIEDVRTIRDYNIAVARYYQALGVLLRKYQIELVPEPTEPY
ncbi:MAG: hypothetical protein CMJ18_17200 [Phycisphaeraceae bacterium]|nr:hypothetical protein [Phycisphaeraceae bacterium]